MDRQPSHQDFVTELKEESWYDLGSHLGVPTNELNHISETYHHDGGASRCWRLSKVHHYLEKNVATFSWKTVEVTLRELKNDKHADLIRSKYEHPSYRCATEESSEDNLQEASTENVPEAEESIRNNIERTQHEVRYMKPIVSYEDLSGEIGLLKQKCQEYEKELEHQRELAMDSELEKHETIDLLTAELCNLRTKYDKILQKNNQDIYKLKLQHRDYENEKAKLKALTSKEVIRDKDADVLVEDWVVQEKEVDLTDDVIGIGEYGEVRVGMFRETMVVVKILFRAISDSNRELLYREIDIISHLRHPNLVQFLGATRIGPPMILTEWMPTSLSVELSKRNITKAQGIAICIDVALALNYLHSWKPCPIIHKGISSNRVLLQSLGTDQQKAKLSKSTTMNFLDEKDMSRQNEYGAPESDTPSRAMDIYSLGILLFEIITVNIPSSSHSERMQEISSKMEAGPIQAFILRCTAEDPSARPSTIDVLKQLKKL